jgi:hypothetical protein
VGVLARVLEANGLATTSISLVREHSEKVKPPRALFVPFPFGHALGRPNDPALQHRVLRAALDLFAAPSGPVLRDFPEDAEPGDQPPAPRQASAIAPAGAVATDPVTEVREVRERHAQWMAKSDGRTAFGLSGVPAARFDDVVRFLQRFADGADADMTDSPAAVALPAFIRWCADDLKTLAFESYMAMTPEAGGDEIARWFWGTTAVAQLLRRVRDRLDASDDPRWKAAAFGIAR